ncbi:hypothetical protein [Candidatus Enterococcus murrayae]|uniref:Uncharacterized protein n=1 Tax=Candidatus Enterococcus murrayae TaxID=2815321 RepID=A0ABS3HBX0_9ENTE|nr:hypothetical protein [Enterococcus sp. MJM16]MBO0450950.1 hypothetical protein [Enterococcus sp. MJM16]
MKYKYDLLSTKLKVLAWIAALSISIFGAIYLHSNYLQVKMLGTWEVIDTELGYSIDNEPKDVVIARNRIKIDTLDDISIEYGGKHSSSNFSRKNEKNEILYYFEGPDAAEGEPDHLLVYNKENPERMILATFPNDRENEEFNVFVLMKKGQSYEE